MACHPTLRTWRGEARLTFATADILICHCWPPRFPSIAHQCIRTNGAGGHKGISEFDIIDTQLWLRLCCGGCRGSCPGPIGASGRREEWEEGDANRWRRTWGDNRKVKSSNVWISIKVKECEVAKRPARDFHTFPKAMLHSEHFYTQHGLDLNSRTLSSRRRCTDSAPTS